MDGKSYEIYLTKDPGVAALLCSALREQGDTKERLSTAWGPAKGAHRIPAISHEGGWYFALAEYEAPENARPVYRIKIC